MLNTDLIGTQYPPVHFDVEKQRLRFFSKATGQTDPVYFDEAAAKAAGHPSLLAPPTFLTTVGVEISEPFQFLEDMNIDLARVLHTNQEYSYFAPVYAGDSLTMVREIDDMFDRRGGALQFVVMKEHYTNQNKVLVATSSFTLVAR